jgi:hypothetical protein
MNGYLLSKNTMSYKKVATEQICGDYYKGHYISFDMIVNASTGYVNSTHICAQARVIHRVTKSLKDWLKTEEGEETLEFLTDRSDAEASVEVTTGPEEIHGVYIHPYLVHRFVTWVKPKFAIDMVEAVTNHTTREYRIEMHRQNQRLDQLNAQMHTMAEFLKNNSA